jgi:hypothetical protein
LSFHIPFLHTFAHVVLQKASLSCLRITQDTTSHFHYIPCSRLRVWQNDHTHCTTITICLHLLNAM